jgi:hypothetical protein
MLHTRKSFAKLCGVQEQQIGVYIKRGKIIEKNKRIDDSIPDNVEFMNSRSIKVAGLEKKIDTPVTDPKEIIERAQALERYNKLTTSRKEMEIEKMNEEVELFRLKKLKLQGKLIPTDVVEILVAQFAKGIYIATAQGIEEIIFSIGKKKSLLRRKISWEQLSALWKH